MISKELKGFKVNRLIKIYYEVFGRFYPTYDILQPSIEISEQMMDESGKRAVYRFKNSEFLEGTEDFTYHFYIVSGIIEALWEREVERPVECKVKKIHAGSKKDNAFYELSIEIK